MKKVWKWLAIPIVIILVAGGLLGYNYYQASAKPSLSNVQTARVSQGDIANYVDATGAVRTRQTAVIPWQASGVAGDIKVKVGDQVKAGQLLASLDQNYLPANIVAAQNDLVTAQEALQNLQQSNTPQAQANVNLLTAQQNYTNTLTTQQNMAGFTNSQAYLNAQQQLMDAQGLVNQLQKAANNPSASAADQAQARGELRGAIGKRDRAQALVDQLGGGPTAEQIAQAQANAILAQAQLQDAQRNYNNVKNGPAAQDIAAAEAKVKSAQATLNLANVYSTFNGTVTQVNNHSGDEVKTGDAAFQIDDNSGLYVDLQVSEVDINKVQAGQAVNLTLDAVPDKTYNGKVVDIGQTGTTSNGAVYYNVTVQFSDNDAKVKPGMTASASITVQQKTGVITVPTTAIQTFNNRSFVEVLNNGTLSRISVQTGMASDTATEITSGNLQPGQQIITNPTAVTFNRSPLAGLFRIFGGGGAGPRGGFGGGGGGFSGGGGNFRGGNGDSNGGNNGGGTNGGSNAGGGTH